MVIAGGAGAHIEDMSRICNAIAELKKGGSLDAAAAAAERANFNYDNLTRFEKYVLRRFFPWYTWNSKNIALQADLIINRPQQMIALERIISAAMDDELASSLPDFLQARFILATGAGRAIVGMNLPIEQGVEQIGKGIGGLLSQAHPALVNLYESLTKESLYYGVPFEKITTAKDVEHLPMVHDLVGFVPEIKNPKNGYTRAAQTGWFKMTAEEARAEAAKTWVGADVEIEHGTYYRVDHEKAPMRMRLLRSLTTSRILSEWNKTTRDSFANGDDAYSAEVDATILERVTALGTGIRPVQLPRIPSRPEVMLKFLGRLEKAGGEQGLGSERTMLPAMPMNPYTDDELPSEAP